MWLPEADYPPPFNDEKWVFTREYFDIKKELSCPVNTGRTVL
jgi:hypothetical protein